MSHLEDNFEVDSYTRSRQFRLKLLAALLVSMGCMNVGMAASQEATTRVIYGSGNHVGPHGRSIVMGADAVQADDVGYRSIVIGQSAHAHNGWGTQEQLATLGSNGDAEPTVPGTLLLGQRRYGRTGSLAIGSLTYGGSALGGAAADRGTADLVDVVSLGTNTYAMSTMGAVMGSYAVANNRFTSSFWYRAYAVQNFGLTSIGAWTQTRSKESSEFSSGMATTALGLANQLTEVNGAEVLGSGNIVKRSFDDDVDRPSGDKTIDNYNAHFVTQIHNADEGAQLVVGHANLTDVTARSQIYGHRNQLTGTPAAGSWLSPIPAIYSDLVSLWGNDNAVDHGDHLTLIGDGNAFSKAKSDIVMGTFSSEDAPVTSLEKSVLLGGLRTGGTVDNNASLLTLVGFGSEVHDSYAVALGAGSVARAGLGNVGYFPTRDAAPTVPATAIWKATQNAVSVGAEGTTRQITGVAAGAADTDAVNVAQLRALRDKIAHTYANGSATTFSANGGDETHLNGDTTKPQNLVFTTTADEHGKKHYDLTLADHLVLGAEPTKNKVEINGNTSTITLGTVAATQLVLNAETGIYTYGDKVTINANEGWMGAGSVRLTSNTNTVEGLSNTHWNANEVVLDRMATEDQLKALSESLRGTDPYVHELQRDMRSLKRDIRQMAAQAGALAGLKTLAFDPFHRTQFAVSLGHYRDRSSVAVGLAHYPREKLLVHAGMTLTGHAMGYIGTSFTLGGLKHGFQSPVTSTEVSYVEETDIATLKAEITAMQAQVGELEALRAEAQALARRAQALANKVAM